MTTAQTPVNRTIANAIAASTLGLLAGAGVTVFSPRSVPYVAAGIVVLCIAVTVTDRVSIGRAAA